MYWKQNDPAHFFYLLDTFFIYLNKKFAQLVPYIITQRGED